jgi:hypothetical protein
MAHARYDSWRSGVEFQADAAAKHARRIVAAMLAEEVSRSAIRPGVAPPRSMVPGTTGSDPGRTKSAVR